MRSYRHASAVRAIFKRFKTQGAAPLSPNLPPISLQLSEQLSSQSKLSHMARNIELRASPLSSSTPQRLALLYSTQKELLQLASSLREERNKIARTKSAAEGRERGAALKKELAEVESRWKVVNEEMMSLGAKLPNETSLDSPEGGYEECEIVKKWFPPSYRFQGCDTSSPASSSSTSSTRMRLGEERTFPLADDGQDHLNLLSWFSFPHGARTAASSFFYSASSAALLSHSLQSYALSVCLQHGYSPFVTPSVVKTEILERCGFEPRGQSSQIFHVMTSTSTTDSEMETHLNSLSLAATAEVPLVAYYSNSVHPASSLPLKLVASGRAFRAEGGGRGRESRGLYRVKEFEKVEMVVVSSPEESAAELERLVEVQREILEGLELPYRVLNMASAELGNSAYKKYDVEVWMPGRGSWGEVCSASNCTDFQSRRLSIKTLPPKGSKPTFAHTLNATALALPRIMLALVENGMKDDQGNKIVELPQTLRRWWIGNEEGMEGEVRWRS
ncbi:seryl-tRNA synthetase [Atractiella rhizophila]|nr:seryl-tRNA synthetase [Atractiella rhizophila]